MNYKIKLYKTKNEDWSTKAYVSLTFAGAFTVTGITVRQGKNGNMFVSMPSYKTSKVDDYGKPEYKEFCNPTTKEFRDELNKNILEAYKKDASEINVKDGSENLKYDVSLNLVSNCGANVEAIGRIYIEKCFVINNVRVINSDKGSFVAMPSQLSNRTNEDGKPVYDDIAFPITKEFRAELYDKILKEKDDMVQKTHEEFVAMDEEIQKQWTPFR